LAALAACTLIAPASAQQNRTTLNKSVTIIAGGAFQQILQEEPRFAVTIQNNNAADPCRLHIGVGTPTEANSILLFAGGSYARFYPAIPSDAFQATCTQAGDTLYVDTQ
jgi:hypothetical protein